MTINFDIDKQNYLPGEKLNGTIQYENLKENEKLVLTLYWYTKGKGNQNKHKQLTINFTPLPLH